MSTTPATVAAHTSFWAKFDSVLAELKSFLLDATTDADAVAPLVEGVETVTDPALVPITVGAVAVLNAGDAAAQASNISAAVSNLVTAANGVKALTAIPATK